MGAKYNLLSVSCIDRMEDRELRIYGLELDNWDVYPKVSEEDEERAPNAHPYSVLLTL